MRLNLANLVRLEPSQAGYAICLASALQLTQCGKLGLIGGDDQLADESVRNRPLVAEGRQPARSFDAQLRLERTWGVVDAAVDHAGVMTRLVGSYLWLLVDDEDR